MKNFAHRLASIVTRSVLLSTMCIVYFQLLSLSSVAQYTKLHDFDIVPDGRNPHGSLISDGTFLYGMTYQGGLNNLGTVFKIMPDGTGYNKLLEFAGAANGSHPWGSLFYDGTFLYGMTEDGGANNLGVIFKVKSDGTGFVKLFDFATAANGYSPRGNLISDGTFLYGVTTNGGTNSAGTIFKIKFDGTGFVKVLDFAGSANGSAPVGNLFSDGTFLYGMTYQGGTSNLGTIFKIKPDGTGFVKLLDFAGATNGFYPNGSLISDGTFLYGMTYGGGTNGFGTIFKIMPDGTGYAKLLDFANASNGRDPYGSLISSGGFLYGMTYHGGINDQGTIFKIKSDGTGFSKLLDFSFAATGALPWGDLISDGSFLYGMTEDGGTNAVGSIFKYSIAPPPPTITNFTPASGLAGTIVTITGKNFDATSVNNVVYLGAVKATVTSATSTQLTVTVPPYASNAPVTVENLTSHLSVISFTNFTPLFDNNKDFGGRIIPASMDFRKDLFLGASGNAQMISLADVDGDGFTDLLAPQVSDSITIFRSKGNGLLTSAGFEKSRLSSGTGVGNHHAIATDMDGDGKLDIVVMVRIVDTDGALIYRNLSNPGSISFAPAFLVSLPFLTINNVDLAAGDMDGDGKPELILEATYGAGKLAVFRNTSSPGSFSFAAKVDITGTGSRGISLGDIDGDGKLDIVNANGVYGGAGFKLIRNTSTLGVLSFDVPVNLVPTNGAEFNNVVLADLDNDGKPDLSWIGIVNPDNGLRVMKNIAVPGAIDATSFAPDIAYGGGEYNLTSASYSQVADMNGDGKPDIIGVGRPTGGFAISQNVSQTGVIDVNSFLEGVAYDGDITATYASQYPVVGDLDGDGKPEVIVSLSTYGAPKISIYKNLSYPAPRIDLLKNNSVATQTGAIGSTLFTQGNYQFTNNQIPGVRFGITSGTAASSTNTQIATTVPGGASNERVAITLHGLTAFSPLPFITTFSSTSTLDATTFANKIDYPLITSAQPGLVVSDFDNDGKPDVVATEGIFNNGRLLHNTLASPGDAITTSIFTSLTNLTTLGANSISAGDFDGDGFVDLQQGSVIFRNNSGTQAEPISFEAGVQSLGGGGMNTERSKTNVDFNHDGKTDLAVVNTGSPGSIGIFENRARAGSFIQYNFPTFNASVNFNATGTLSETTAGDFDGDGYDDIVFLNTSGNQLQYMLNQKLNRVITLAQFGVIQGTATGTSPAYIIAQDFDLDGKLDVAVAYTTIATVSVFKNTSTAGVISFTKQDFTSLANAVKIDAADLDGDGKAEIVTIHGTTSPFNFSILKNTSTSGISFATKIDYTLPTQPVGLALADINLDAKTDILISRSGPFLSIFENSMTSGPSINVNTQPASVGVCDGSTTSFTVIASGTTNLTYQWQKLNTSTLLFENIANVNGYSGVTTSTLTINTKGNFGNGDYRCEVSGNNATPVFTQTVSLTFIPSPTLAEITNNGTTLTASPADSYQWYQNDVAITGETDQSFEFNALEYGIYKVDVTDNGCTSTSVEYEYLITGTENSIGQLKIYPNPVEGNLFVEFNPPYQIQITDVLGNNIKNEEAEVKSIVLDFTSLPTGTYFIQVKNKNERHYARMIKK